MNETSDTGRDEGSQESWNVDLQGRYILDLSFENPGAPVIPNRDDLRFDVSVQVDVRYRDDLHEVALTVWLTATHEDQVAFIMELTYAGLFKLTDMGGDENEELRQRFLFREAPRILFPWVDRIFADLARDGGLPQMNLSPPDFAALHEQRQAEPKDAKITPE